MPAPKGNQFWKLRSKHGRDKLFATPQLMWEAACEYFEWCDEHPFIEVEQKKGTINLKIDNVSDDSKKEFKESINSMAELPKMRPYTIQGLTLYLDCSVGYFNDFEAAIKDKDDEISKDFSAVITRIKQTIFTQKFDGAASGFFNPTIIARDLGLVDKQEAKHDVSEELKNLLTPFKVKRSE